MVGVGLDQPGERLVGRPPVLGNRLVVLLDEGQDVSGALDVVDKPALLEISEETRDLLAAHAGRDCEAGDGGGAVA